MLPIQWCKDLFHSSYINGLLYVISLTYAALLLIRVSWQLLWNEIFVHLVFDQWDHSIKTVEGSGIQTVWNDFEYQ